jgi:hypothetical protein
MLFVEVRGSEGIRLRGRSAREIALRKVGAVTGHRLIGAQQRNATDVALPTEHFRSGVARRTTTHDKERSRHASRYRRRLLVYALELFSHIHGVVPLLDAPTGDGI